MAIITQVVTANTNDAHRFKAKHVVVEAATTDAQSAAVTEANRLMAEVDRLATEATHARQEAERAQLVL
jgi:hypothetical protein